MTTATATESPTTDNESFAALFEESLLRQEMRAGELITAEVVRIDQNFVVVNAGLKSESYISIDEFKGDNGEVEVTPGDYVTVAIEALEDGHGETRLSREKAEAVARRLAGRARWVLGLCGAAFAGAGLSVIGSRWMTSEIPVPSFRFFVTDAAAPRETKGSIMR